MTTIFVSDVIKKAFPFLKPYINETATIIRPILKSLIPDDKKAQKIINIYTSKAMGTVVYALANLCYVAETHRQPQKEDKKAIVGVSLISLSSSFFDDAIDEEKDRVKRSYLIALADLCSSRGFIEIESAKIDQKIKDEVIEIVKYFQSLSWRSNLYDQGFKRMPTLESCENALDVIGLPVEAGARAGLALARAKNEKLALAARGMGQIIALLDDILDIELDLKQGFNARYPLYFALRQNPGIKNLVKRGLYKEVYISIMRTQAIQECKKIFTKKLQEINNSGLLDIQFEERKIFQLLG